MAGYVLALAFGQGRRQVESGSVCQDGLTDCWSSSESHCQVDPINMAECIDGWPQVWLGSLVSRAILDENTVWSIYYEREHVGSIVVHIPD